MSNSPDSEDRGEGFLMSHGFRDHVDEEGERPRDSPKPRESGDASRANAHGAGAIRIEPGRKQASGGLAGWGTRRGSGRACTPGGAENTAGAVFSVLVLHQTSKACRAFQPFRPADGLEASAPAR